MPARVSSALRWQEFLKPVGHCAPGTRSPSPQPLTRSPRPIGIRGDALTRARSAQFPGSIVKHVRATRMLRRICFAAIGLLAGARAVATDATPVITRSQGA